MIKYCLICISDDTTTKKEHIFVFMKRAMIPNKSISYLALLENDFELEQAVRYVKDLLQKRGYSFIYHGIVTNIVVDEYGHIMDRQEIFKKAFSNQY